jgi:hypothetical protein
MQENRETWLNFVAGKLAPAFASHGAPLPSRVRVAIGFPSTGSKGKRIGECWDKTASRDGAFEIFIRPDIDEPNEAAAILAHELCHAAAGIDAGHGKPFRKIALAIGLQGKMKSTTAGPEFLALVAPILDAAGPLPHARLRLDGLTTKPKKQSARLIKCECTECGYIVRAARKWIDEKGAPHCPEHGAMRAELPDDEEEPDELPQLPFDDEQEEDAA